MSQLKYQVDRYEKMLIIRALMNSHLNIASASEFLGEKRTSLSMKMRRYEIRIDRVNGLRILYDGPTKLLEIENYFVKNKNKSDIPSLEDAQKI